MPMKIMMDNLSAINLAKHQVAHGRSKHIETGFHFLRDQVEKGKIELVHWRTEDQIADIMTKPLKIERFERLKSMLGVWLTQLIGYKIVKFVLVSQL